MKLGYLGGRADSRGLAYQSQGFCKWLRPDRVLGLDMTTDNLSPYPNDWSVFEGQCLTIVRPSELTQDLIRAWSADLDVVLGAETFYKDEVVSWLRDAGVRTVCQVNPEFVGYFQPNNNDPRPDVLVNPTIWQMEHLPGAYHLPFPVDRDVFPFRLRTKAEHFVHIAGHRAMADRAGTRTVMGALTRRRSNRQQTFSFTLRSQSEIGFTMRGPHRFEVQEGNISDPRALYEDADVVVLPRRYGGQCLSMNEALSCGIPVIALDRVPENNWGGVIPLRAKRRMQLRCKAGMIDTYDTSPVNLNQLLDRLVAEPATVEAKSREADIYAESISWERLLPVWRDFLGAVAEGRDPISVLARA